jgi:hypothetical protein
MHSLPPPPDAGKIVSAFRVWYAEAIINNQIESVRKAGKIANYSINPFMAPLVYAFFTAIEGGDGEPHKVSEGIASALVYQKIVGTSLSTSMGTLFQQFIAAELEKCGRGGSSVTSGMDLEFYVQEGGEVRRKFLQLKLGPQTINSGDVTSIVDDFIAVRNLARTNDMKIRSDDFYVGVIYGCPDDLSANYKKITNKYGYPVLIGAELWSALFGIPDLYSMLIKAAAEVAGNQSGTGALYNESTKSIKALADSGEIRLIAGLIGNVKPRP